MTSYCQKNEYVPDSFVEEALATIQALRFADELGFRNIELEEDSLTVVRKRKEPTENRSYISALMKDEKEIGNNFFFFYIVVICMWLEKGIGWLIFWLKRSSDEIRTYKQKLRLDFYE
ncbi:hypothetical protein J1N35_038321 [Gossypium stocksii]|uniref:RNase H type-1 domain-containing protein n=1 Tax=Gossypium stocksii TaxID=47602 RepID=A0A9D3ZML5_9ROSI|nr:hypothetical protein J1N35_038321 [Gossypium stocksii]